MSKPLVEPVTGITLLLLLALAALPAALAGAQVQAEGPALGSGDGQIHVIPWLSAPSVKNGDHVLIQAVVKAVEGIARVQARIDREASGLVKGAGPVAEVALQPADAGVGEAAVWQAEWRAAGLREGYYRLRVTVTDRTGHTFTDKSVVFSDPIAGNDAVGSAAYPTGGMTRLDSAVMPWAETSFGCAVIDPAAGYAYFGTNQGVVVKVALGDGSVPPTRVGQLRLPSTGWLRHAVIDASNGYAYFATGINKLVKIALGEGDTLPREVGVLEPGEELNNLLIDPINGYAYYTTGMWPPNLVKVALGAGDAVPAPVGRVPLESEHDAHLWCAAMDAAAGYAYFATASDPSTILKVALGEGDALPSQVGSVTLATGENAATTAVIDPERGYAYFVTSFPCKLVKVALGEGAAPPSRAGVLALPTPFTIVAESAAIDTARGYAYFERSTSPREVLKVVLGEGNAPPSLVSTTTLSADAGNCCCVIDESGGHAYLGDVAGIVLKMALGEADAPPTEVAALALYPGTGEFKSGVVDAANGYAYFGTHDAPARVVKVALGSGSVAPEWVGTLVLDPGENYANVAVIDAASGHAFFATDTAPAKLVKVALGEGNSPPTRLGATTMYISYASCGVIDEAQGYAYFGNSLAPGTVAKVALGSGDEPPYSVAAVMLAPDEIYLKCAVIDTENGYAYFGAHYHALGPDDVPAKVVKVALGAGSAAPVRVGAVELPEDEDNFAERAAVIDTTTGYAYFATATLPGKVVKIAVGAGSAPPSRVGAVTLDSGEYMLAGAAIDHTNSCAYFNTDTWPGKVIKVGLGPGSAPPSRISALTLGPHETAACAVLDPEGAYAWLGCSGGEAGGAVVRVALSPLDLLKATKLALPEDAKVGSLSFYSHAAAGNLRLALYDDTPERGLMWQSALLSNGAAESWMTIPVSGGIPALLSLAAGTYWLAWQTDTITPVASYSDGAAGDGLCVPVDFGPFPSALHSGTAAPTLSNERWSGYIAYDSLPVRPGNPGSAAAATDSITWTWQDNSADESGFKLFTDAGASPPTTLRMTTGPDVQSWRQDGLSPNTQYTFQVCATTESEDSLRTDPFTSWTLAAVPAAPKILYHSSGGLLFAIGAGDGNPDYTQYAVRVLAGESGESWVQVDGTLGEHPFYQTAAQWQSTQVQGTDVADWSVTVQAMNGAGVPTALSAEAEFPPLPAAGWLLALALLVSGLLAIRLSKNATLRA